jgi:hypothetical protein
MAAFDAAHTLSGRLGDAQAAISALEGRDR